MTWAGSCCMSWRQSCIGNGYSICSIGCSRSCCWCADCIRIYLWLEKGTLWVLVNSSWSSKVAWYLHICRWVSTRSWRNHHVVYQLLLPVWRSVNCLDCSMLFSVLVEIKWLAKGCLVHVICCLRIHHTGFRPWLSNHEMMRRKNIWVLARWTWAGSLNLQIDMWVLRIKSSSTVLLWCIGLRKHSLSGTTSCSTNISMLLILRDTLSCVIQVRIRIYFYSLGHIQEIRTISGRRRLEEKIVL